MDRSSPALRDLGLGFRIGITFTICSLLGGYAVAGVFLNWEYENRDERPGLTMDDITGAYHGVLRVSALLASLREGHPPELPATDRAVLVQWLEGERVAEDYDSLDLGDAAPAEIIAMSCLECHARNPSNSADALPTMPLEYWDDIEPLAFTREISPKAIQIVAASTHAHAPSMAMILLLMGALALFTRAPRRLTGAVFAVGAIALCADMGGQWGARVHPAFVYAITAGGLIYVIAVFGLALVALGDCWFPRTRAIRTDITHTPG